MLSADTGNTILKNNAKMRGKSTARYRDIRSLYYGQANEVSSALRPPLTPEQIAIGRKRVKTFYTKRNKRIWTQVVWVTTVTIGLISIVLWKSLG